MVRLQLNVVILIYYNLMMNIKPFQKVLGITKGLQVTAENFAILKKEDILLLGTVDGVNTIFLTPNIFIYDANYKIIVYKNGVKQLIGDDFTIFESSGPGTGYDGILFTVPPTVIPTPIDVMTTDYYISNI